MHFQPRASAMLTGWQTHRVHPFRMTSRLTFRMKIWMRRKQMLSDDGTTRNVGWGASSHIQPINAPFSMR